MRSEVRNSRGSVDESKVEAQADEDSSKSGAVKNFGPKRWVVIGSIVAAVVVIVIGGVILAGRLGKPAQAAPPPVDVEVVQVEQRDVPVYSEWIGTTDGMVNADIKAEVTGYLLRQDYREGASVNRGDLMFELDPRPFQAVVDQDNGQVAQFE